LLLLFSTHSALQTSSRGEERLGEAAEENRKRKRRRRVPCGVMLL
jgi:hypothetical protein